MNQEQGNPDREYCPNFERTGTCIHGELCTKIHRTPEISRCIVFHHLYPDPQLFADAIDNPSILQFTNEEKTNYLNAFYLDVYYMLIQFGPLEDLLIASNRTESMVGNVFAMFREVDAAAACLLALNHHYYAGRKILITFTPITRLSSAVCQGIDDGKCQLGDKCFFIHPFNVPIYSEVFPRVQRMFATPFRRGKKIILETPQNALYPKEKKDNKTFSPTLHRFNLP